MVETNLSLSTLKDGGLEEVFQRELENVLENISDLNTDAAKARKIAITLEFKPNADRDDVRLSFQVKTTVAPFQKQEASIYVGQEKGKKIALEHQKGVIKNQVSIEEAVETSKKEEQKIIKMN